MDVRYLVLIVAAPVALTLGCGDEAGHDSESGRDAATSTVAGMDGGAVGDASASGAGGTGGSGGAAGASIDMQWQPLWCDRPEALRVQASLGTTATQGCWGCNALGCCEEINACAAVKGGDGCGGIEANISSCLGRRGIAAATATSAEIEACLEEPNRLSRAIAENAELVPAIVALFDCIRSAPSATCYPDFDDGGVPVPTTLACDANTEDDAGTPPQTCLEQCRKDWPALFACPVPPNDPEAPKVCHL